MEGPDETRLKALAEAIAGSARKSLRSSLTRVRLGVTLITWPRYASSG